MPSLEVLLPLFFVLLVLLQNVLAAALRKRQAQREEAEARPPVVPLPPPPVPVAPPAPPALPRQRSREALPVSSPVLPSPTLPQRSYRHHVRLSIGNLHEIRRGVVLMMLLGPCRAEQPVSADAPRGSSAAPG